MITFKAENGEILVAQNEAQAVAFSKAGLVEVKEEPKKAAKTTEKE